MERNSCLPLLLTLYPCIPAPLLLPLILYLTLTLTHAKEYDRLQSMIEDVSIGTTRQSDVAKAAVKLDDGPGILIFAEQLLEVHARSKTHIEVQPREGSGFGAGVTRAFYNAVALELQAREQNKKISLWLGDGPEETYHLTSAVLRPVMVNPSSEKA